MKDKTIGAYLRMARNHGIDPEATEAEAVLIGTNAKMNEFEAAMGLCNLKTIDRSIRFRKRLYERYVGSLSGIESIQLQKIVASKWNYGYMPVLFRDKKIRDCVYTNLLKSKIRPRKYFYPLTSSPRYVRKITGKLKEGELRNASYVSDRILCLPLYPDLKTVDWICNRIMRLETERRKHNSSLNIKRSMKS